MKKFLLISFSLFCLTAFAQVNLEEGIIAQYMFTGNTNDNSGNGNNGILYGPLLTKDRFGRENHAYYFDGLDDFIEITPISDVSAIGDFSMSLWVNCYSWETQVTPESNIIDKQYIFDGRTHSSTVSYDFDREGFHINYTNTDDGSNFIYNTILISTSEQYVYPLEVEETLIEKWHHNVFLRKNNETFHYVDGVLVEQNSSTNHLLNMQHNWFIGTFSGNNPNYNDVNYNFHGVIDDIIFYNRALTEEEVLTLQAEEPFSIKTISQQVLTSENIRIPVHTSNIIADENISSYQFDLNYDSNLMEFLSSNITNTLSEGGTIDINNSTPGLLKVSFMTSNIITGEPLLLSLDFKPLHHGEAEIVITDFFFNTYPVTDISSSVVSIGTLYGDIDGNELVQAYDASLVLKNSVGLDPIPDTDPIPWENWRVVNADVDGSPGITASDASYILMWTTGNITEFPIESGKKAFLASSDNIEIKHEDGNLNFYAAENLFGLNVSINVPEFIELGEVQILNENFISAVNINDTTYNIGLAAAYAPATGEKILSVPLNVIDEGSLIIKLVVNTTYQETSLDFVITGINNQSLPDLKIFPNPVTEIVRINGITNPTHIQLYSTDGKLVFSRKTSMDCRLDLSVISRGAYILKIQNEEGIRIESLIKK